jgi:hypothetical protein
MKKTFVGCAILVVVLIAVALGLGNCVGDIFVSAA